MLEEETFRHRLIWSSESKSEKSHLVCVPSRSVPTVVFFVRSPGDPTTVQGCRYSCRTRHKFWICFTSSSLFSTRRCLGPAKVRTVTNNLCVKLCKSLRPYPQMYASPCPITIYSINRPRPSLPYSSWNPVDHVVVSYNK